MIETLQTTLLVIGAVTAVGSVTALWFAMFYAVVQFSLEDTTSTPTQSEMDDTLFDQIEEFRRDFS